MEAQTLNCPMCGAAASTDSPNCLYCESRLGTVACPSCFGMMFVGSRHCPHCGAMAERALTTAAAPRHCPRCRVEMDAVTVGTTTLRECPHCEGLWVDVAALEQICADREQQAAVLGTASPAHSTAMGSGAANAVRYVPCPECGQLMNRLNFARYSGVIVDACKKHGTWFDRDELRQIVEFIRHGGLDTVRAREKEQIAEERRQLQLDQLAANTRGEPLTGMSDREDHTGTLAVVGDLLNSLFQ